METFKINIEKHEYTIHALEEKEQILYEVYDDDLLCILSVNENAEWEANNNYQKELVQKFGEAINQHES